MKLGTFSFVAIILLWPSVLIVLHHGAPQAIWDVRAVRALWGDCRTTQALQTLHTPLLTHETDFFTIRMWWGESASPNSFCISVNVGNSQRYRLKAHFFIACYFLSLFRVQMNSRCFSSFFLFHLLTSSLTLPGWGLCFHASQSSSPRAVCLRGEPFFWELLLRKGTAV